MQLTNELLKFCRKNLVALDEWLDKDDRRVYRKADLLWDRLQGAVNVKLEELGLEGLPECKFNERLSIEEVMPGLISIQALADVGSFEALEALFDMAKASGRGVRTMERLWYTLEHPLPWQLKPAQQYPEAATKGAAARIDDGEVARMLHGMENKIRKGEPEERKQSEGPEEEK